MNNKDNDIVLFNKIKRLFKKPKLVAKGQLGIYHYIWGCDTINNDSNAIKYDIYLKIKASEIYDELVEIEVVDVTINDSANQDIINIIKANLPKYVDPRYVNWQIILNPNY